MVTWCGTVGVTLRPGNMLKALTFSFINLRNGEYCSIQMNWSSTLDIRRALYYWATVLLCVVIFRSNLPEFEHEVIISHLTPHPTLRISGSLSSGHRNNDGKITKSDAQQTSRCGSKHKKSHPCILLKVSFMWLIREKVKVKVKVRVLSLDPKLALTTSQQKGGSFSYVAGLLKYDCNNSEILN